MQNNNNVSESSEAQDLSERNVRHSLREWSLVVTACFFAFVALSLVLVPDHHALLVAIAALFFVLLQSLFQRQKRLGESLLKTESALGSALSEGMVLQAKIATLEASSDRYQALLDSLPDLAWIKDRDGKFLAVNAHFQQAFGYSQEMLIGKTDFDISHPNDAKLYRADDEKVMEEVKPLCREFLARNVDGSKNWVELIKVPVLEDGKVVGTAGTARDISERKEAQLKLDYLAHYDSLTGIKNRYSLEQDTSALIEKNTPFFLAFFDLDNFKLINDSLGHLAGDKVLIKCAQRIEASIGETGEVYRLSGDEFVVVIQGEFCDATLADWSEKLLNDLAKTNTVESFDLELSMSAGIAMYPQHGQSCWELLKNADIAMYQAKLAGKRGHKVFSESFAGLAMHQLSMENRLRKAIDEQELFLRYQPMVNSQTGQLIGMEALIRWSDPVNGEISPAEFIPFAEQTGMIADIGHFVIEQAIKQQREWLDQGYRCVPISVNVSGLQFRQAQLVENIASLLLEYQVSGELLELEMTESLLLKDESKLLNTFKQIRALGISLSIDDFGTGYSNLAYLSRFPISKLKIDRSFIRDLHVKPDQQIITQTIIDLAKSLRLSVIGEGVETTQELRQLNKMGCMDVQGFYFAKPLLVEEMEPVISGLHTFRDRCDTSQQVALN